MENFSKPSKKEKKIYEHENILITLTIFSVEQDFIEFMATNFIKQLCEKLQYTLTKYTCGKHIDASKQHYHIMFQASTNGSQTYKTLNNKIIRTYSEILFPSKEIADTFRNTDKAISFVKEGQPKPFKKKTIYYGEEAMRYTFKEYTHNNEIQLHLQHGFTDAELFAMRESANTEWKIVKKKFNDQALRDIEKKDRFKNLQTFLRNQMKDLPKYDDSDETIRYVMKQIVIYNKRLYKEGKVETLMFNQLWNKAVSFLVFEEYIDEDEIISRDPKFKY